jgi:hypothetical protein
VAVQQLDGLFLMLVEQMGIAHHHRHGLMPKYLGQGPWEGKVWRTGLGRVSSPNHSKVNGAPRKVRGLAAVPENGNPLQGIKSSYKGVGSLFDSFAVPKSLSSLFSKFPP